MSDEPTPVLLGYTRESYEGSFHADLLEQYKLYVQSAENGSARRVASNRHLLTLNIALIALYGGLQSAGLSQNYWLLLVPVTGMLASFLWYRIIKSYRDLNTVKFKVIHELEQHLPAALFRYEWELAEHGQGKAYNPVTHIEQWLPIAFCVLHFILAVIIGLNNAEALRLTR